MQIANRQGINSFTNFMTKSPWLANVPKKYYSKLNFSDNKDEVVAKHLTELSKKFKEHRALKHPFFEYLKEEKGFNAKQYQVFRDNFFYRTAFTVPGVLHVIKAALLDGDLETAHYVAKNLNDELAITESSSKMHPKLLEKSFNNFGETIFGIDGMPISGAENSQYLLSEALTDRDVRKAGYEAEQALKVYATSWAHEFLADGMLQNFYKDVFLPYEKTYDITKKDSKFQDDISPYFLAHNDPSKEHGDVEAEHERIARKVVSDKILKSSENPRKSLNLVDASTMAFFESQSKLWDAIMNAMQKVRENGVPVSKDNIVMKNNINLDGLLQDYNNAKSFQPTQVERQSQKISYSIIPSEFSLRKR